MSNVSTDAERKIRDLLSVLEISRTLAARSEMQPLLETIEQSALRVLDCERASVFFHDAASDELVSRVATGMSVMRFASDQGLAGQAFRTGLLINLEDAYADPRFNPIFDQQTGFRTRSILTCPLLSWDNVPIGVLQVLNKRLGCFDPWDEVVVRTLSAQAGVALQRHLLLNEFAKKQRFERDLAIARQIQRDLLPRSAPQAIGFDIAGWNQPADETGGDFFDFHTLAGNHLAFSLGDVTGHGIGPALVAAECRALLRALALKTQDLTQLITLTNQLLCEDLSDCRFVTVFLGLLDPALLRMQFISAGQGPIFFFESGTQEIRTITPHGIPLGVLPEYEYHKQGEIVFAPGDIFLVLTDGFVEWPDTDGRRYGAEPILEVIRQHQKESAQEIIRNMYQAVHRLVGKSPQEDDLTAIVIKKC